MAILAAPLERCSQGRAEQWSAKTRALEAIYCSVKSRILHDIFKVEPKTRPPYDPALTFLEMLSEVVKMVETSPCAKTKGMVQFLPGKAFRNLMDGLLQTQEEFRSAGKPFNLDLGIHYTRKENLSSIATHGLLTRNERTNQKIKAIKENGSKIGDGVYTAADPRAYHGLYGDVGIIVVRLLGVNKDWNKGKVHGLSDSLTEKRHEWGVVVVLSSSRQCVPVLWFDASHIDPKNPLSPGNMTLLNYLTALQNLHQLAFHGHCVATSPPCQPIYETIRYEKRPVTSGDTRPVEFKSTRCTNCQICLGNYSNTSFVRRRDCNHVFHKSCIAQFTPVCPVCAPQSGRHNFLGKMPSGVMMVRRSPLQICEGYKTTGSIVIEYIVPRDVQESYHPNPGVMHDGAYRIAYLPDTAQGHNLLKRLKFAFSRGLTFKVGVSMTSGRDNSVTWASIHHKTSLTGGPARHGFPDTNYFTNCNRELDVLCVPVAGQL